MAQANELPLWAKLQAFWRANQFWVNQELFLRTGKTEEQRLGHAWQKCRETISAVGFQKELADYYFDAPGTHEEKIAEVWKRRAYNFMELTRAADPAELLDNRELWGEIFQALPFYDYSADNPEFETFIEEFGYL